MDEKALRSAGLVKGQNDGVKILGDGKLSKKYSQSEYRDALRQLRALVEQTGPTFVAFMNMAHTLMRLGRPADADVADRGGDQNALGTVERAQHDLNGEFAAVLTAGGELHPGAHRARRAVGAGAAEVMD